MSAPAAAPHRTISQFCDHVCMYVRFRPDHEAITAELTAHLEDHKDAILEIHPDMTLWEAERRAVEARCTVKTSGVTGVEMEALTGVSTALLTIYDMCKAVDKGMELGEIHLEKKSGGKSGLYIRAEGGYV